MRSGAALPVPDVIAGNLCRCTGYGPILDAGEAVTSLPRDDAALAETLTAIAGAGASGEWRGRRWFVPTSGDELADLLAAHPRRADRRGRDRRRAVGHQGAQDARYADLRRRHRRSWPDRGHAEALTIGAAVRYADLHELFMRLHPDLGELIRRFAGLQVRNAGTIGGNIANGSPIGDGPPALIALGAELTLRSARGRRTLRLEEFFLDYGRQTVRPTNSSKASACRAPARTR